MKSIDNKYKIIKSLGGGAFSEVFLVKGPDEAEVALKLLKAEITLHPSERNLTCFKNEFSILKNLNHPNIGAILDFGLDEERMQYYFTTEYVDGADIFNGTKDKNVAEITELFVQALRALEYLHSYRIYHFDIKAANLLLTSKDQLKLIDFGLASLDPKGKLMGTPSYMPPEIVRKEKPDWRADFYSLGVLWYYCLARKNPFRAGDPRVTVQNQINMELPPIATYNTEVPEYIEQIIKRMTEKRPEKRYERASQIIKELNLLGGYKFETETSQTLLSYIPEKGRFIGRKEEIAAINSSIIEVKEKKSPNLTILISGKEGVGKKRLLEEIKYFTQLNDIPTQLQDRLITKRKEDLFYKIEKHLKSKDPIKTFLLNSASWIEENPKTIEQLKDVLSKISAHDRDSSVIFAFTLESGSDLSKELESFIDIHLDLKNFTEEELKEYLINLTGLEKVPDFLVDEIIKRTEGNPLYVTELSKSLITSGAIFDTKGRRSDSSFIDLGVDFETIFPESLKDLLLRAYHKLEDKEKEILEALSTAKTAANSYRISRWSDIEDISSHLENLVQMDLLVRENGYEYYFRNKLLAGYIYDQIPNIKREAYHDQIANDLRNSSGDEEEIAKHIGLGSNHQKGFETAFSYGKNFLAEGMGKRALDFFTIALRYKSEVSVKESVELHLKTGEAYLIGQEYAEAMKFFNEASNILAHSKRDSSNIEWQIDNLIKIGGTYIKLGELKSSRDVFDSAMELLSQTSENPIKTLLIKNFQAYLDFQEGKLNEAEKLFSENRENWLQLPKELRSKVTNNELGMVLMGKGELEKATETFKNDLDYYKEIKDELLITRTYYNLAQTSLMTGKYDLAIHYLKKSQKISRKTKNLELLLCTYNALGNIYIIVSKLKKAKEQYEKARNLSHQLGDFKNHAATSINIGIIENERGNRDVAYYELYPALLYLKNTQSKSLFEWQILFRGELEMAEIMISKKDFAKAYTSIESARIAKEHVPEDKSNNFWINWTEAHYHKEKNELVDYQKKVDELKDLASSDEEKNAINKLEGKAESDIEKTYKAILEINKLINSEKSLDAVLNTILIHVLEFSDAESAAILLKKEDDRLHIVKQKDVLGERKSEMVSLSIARKAINKNEIIETEHAFEDPNFSAEESIQNMELKSAIAVPIHSRDIIIGVLYLATNEIAGFFKRLSKEILISFADQIGIAIEKAKTIDDLSAKTKKMESELEEKNSQLKSYEEIMEQSVHGFITENAYPNIIGRSKEMSEILQTVDKIVDTDISVLISGESGTGKELIARALHYNSDRKEAKFVAINCGAIPTNLMESELFGYKAGAFTGAVHDKAGLFEVANEGTIFLDEISELEPALQVKLLRVIQEKELTRIGETKPRKCNVRIITATNRNIEMEVKDNKFREDLYWRICQIKLELPALRERREDIPLLIKFFMKNDEAGKNKTLSPSLLKKFVEYNWPGNIRELENLISVSCALTAGNIIDEKAIPANHMIRRFIDGEKKETIEIERFAKIDHDNEYQVELSWRDYESRIIAKAYMANEYRARKAAKELGIAPTTMYNKIKELDLEVRDNPLYIDEFVYTRGRTLRSYTLPIFQAALIAANNKALKAIKNLKVSQGFFYKVIKG